MKTLIYFNKNELKPTGGPAGYLYNLKQELDKNKIDNIEFLNLKTSKVKKIVEKIPSKYVNKLKDIINYYPKKVIRSVFNKEKVSPINLNDYEIIHFHNALSMYLVKDSLDTYNGKVIFTTHCPKVSHKEIIEDCITEKYYKKHKEILDKLEIIDEYAFNRADYIIFPTEQSEECYYNTWDKYKEIKENNKDKYLYLPTGINEITVKVKREEIRKKYNIPSDAFVITYVGRHNKVKGSDQLLKIGKKILDNHENVYFLNAGLELPMSGLNHERWIEVGWTNDPHSIINACDVFMLPNKETYFDLILLEVMNIGKNIVLTETGGNKYFKKFVTDSLQFYNYNDIDEAIEKIEYYMNNNENNNSNKEIFNKEFTMEIFLNNYINKLKMISLDNKKKELVTIVVPIYNMEKYLDRCIQSILKQDYENIEIILVNDGSIDNSLDICKKYKKDNNNIIIIDKKNEGVSIARNEGIKNAKGEWIMFVDPDDYLENNIVSTLVNSARNSEDIVSCSCKIDKGNIITDAHFFKKSFIACTLEDKERLFLQLLDLNYEQVNAYTAIGVPWAKIYRTDFFNKNNLLFDRKLKRMQDNIFNVYAY